MTVDLYYADLSPPSRAALVVAQTLGVDVNVKNVNFFKGEQNSPEYLKLNPNHTIPTLVDDGFVLFESRAIMVYLINRYNPKSSLYPEDVKTRALVDQVLYFDATSLWPVIRTYARTKFFEKKEPDQEIIDLFKEKLSVLEKILADNKFLTGNELTLADISVAVSIPALERFVSKAFITEKLQQWIERCYDVSPLLKTSNDKYLNAPLPAQ